MGDRRNFARVESGRDDARLHATVEIFASFAIVWAVERSRDVTKQAKKDKYLKSWKVRVELGIKDEGNRRAREWTVPSFFQEQTGLIAERISVQRTNVGIAVSRLLRHLHPRLDEIKTKGHACFSSDDRASFALSTDRFSDPSRVESRPISRTKKQTSFDVTIRFERRGNVVLDEFLFFFFFFPNRPAKKKERMGGKRKKLTRVSVPQLFGFFAGTRVASVEISRAFSPSV